MISTLFFGSGLQLLGFLSAERGDFQAWKKGGKEKVKESASEERPFLCERRRGGREIIGSK